jgi:hypothetical protein
MFALPSGKKVEKENPLAAARPAVAEVKIPIPLPGQSPTKEMEMG